MPWRVTRLLHPVNTYLCLFAKMRNCIPVRRPFCLYIMVILFLVPMCWYKHHTATAMCDRKCASTVFKAKWHENVLGHARFVLLAVLYIDYAANAGPFGSSRMSFTKQYTSLWNFRGEGGRFWRTLHLGDHTGHGGHSSYPKRLRDPISNAFRALGPCTLLVQKLWVKTLCNSKRVM